jgi:hypothetical protein
MLAAALAAALDCAKGERSAASVEDEGLVAMTAWDTTTGVAVFGPPIAPGLEEVAGAADRDWDAAGDWPDVAGCSAAGGGSAALDDSGRAPVWSAAIVRAPLRRAELFLTLATGSGESVGVSPGAIAGAVAGSGPVVATGASAPPAWLALVAGAVASDAEVARAVASDTEDAGAVASDAEDAGAVASDAEDAGAVASGAEDVGSEGVVANELAGDDSLVVRWAGSTDCPAGGEPSPGSASALVVKTISATATITTRMPTRALRLRVLPRSPLLIRAQGAQRCAKGGQPWSPSAQSCALRPPFHRFVRTHIALGKVPTHARDDP